MNSVKSPLRTWSELMDATPPPARFHGADDIVLGSSRDEPGSMTRLEAAEQERRALTMAELDRHRDNTDTELARHRREMDNILYVFSLRLGVA